MVEMGPIAFFDSGMGGLTVLHETMQLIPNAKYIYFADTVNIPYGTKSSEHIRELVIAHAKYIDQFNPKALVLACNTATSVVVHELRQIYDYPIVGMEPAVKPASEISDSDRILVTATDKTLSEEKLERLISGLRIQDRVDRLSLQELVVFAESKEFQSDRVMKYLNSQFEAIDWERYNSIVLGCTHFIYFRQLIKTLIPDSVLILDGNQGTAKRIKQLIQHDGKSNTTSLTYHESMKESDLNKIDDFLNYLKLSHS